MNLLPILALLTLAAEGPAVPGARASEGPRYALIPARNLSGDPGAPAALLDALKRELERRGAEFVGTPEVEGVLRAQRIRYTDSISTHDLHALGALTGAQFALVTTILDYMPGELPRVALSLRALSTATGARVLSSVVALRGEDFQGLLGLGRIDDVHVLADEALQRVLETFDERGAPLAASEAPKREARPEPPEGGQGFVRDDFDPASLERVALLPLQNRSTNPDASTQFGEFLGDAWFRACGVQVCEIADVRASLIAQRVRSMQYVDLERLAEIGRAIGVRYFVLGTVERYGDEVLVQDQRYPEVEATIQLIDAESGQIVAAAGVRRLGNDYETVLGLSVVRDPTELAIRVAREIVAALGG